MELIKGKIQSAQKIVIYGPEGIGKSTFASQFPAPLFIDTEGSTKHMDVIRVPKPTSWAMLLEQVKEVKQRRICSTLVIDTIDWAEQLCLSFICAKSNKTGIEDFGYGNGYVYEKEEFGKFLNLLEEVVESGKNVVLTAHAQLRKFEQPDEAGAYDRWELKLGKKTASQISPLVKEWADMVLFANYKTYAIATDDKSKKFKGQGGLRVMYTNHHPCWDGKNRCGLPGELKFDYSEIASCIPNLIPELSNQPEQQSTPVNVQPAVSEPVPVSKETISTKSPDPVKEDIPFLMADIPKALLDLMMPNKVTPEEIQKAVAEKGYYPEDTPISTYDNQFINGVLIGAWEQVFSMIKNNRSLPFGQ
jgi:RecA/RadA recombinase